MDFRSLTQRQRSIISKEYCLRDLKRYYDQVCEKLDKDEKEKYRQSSRTLKEEEVFKKIKESTKLSVLRSVWIGKRNVDFFIPYLSGKKEYGIRGYTGLVIEVNGDYHYHYGKMKKDNAIYEDLHSLNIGLYILENANINQYHFRNLLNQLHRLPKIDYRAKCRLMRNLYLKTILDNEDLIERYELSEIKVFIQLFKEAC